MEKLTLAKFGGGSSVMAVGLWDEGGEIQTWMNYFALHCTVLPPFAQEPNLEMSRVPRRL